MNIVILGEGFGFPKGLASSNYVRLMARGLVHAGANVHAVSLGYAEIMLKPQEAQIQGQVDGVSWEYASASPNRPSTLLRRVWVKTRANLVTPKRLFELSRAGLLDVVIYYGSSYLLLRQYSYLCHFLNVPFVADLVEWLPAISSRKGWHRVDSNLYNEKVFQLADGLIVISRYLEDRAKERGSHRKRSLACHKMPILVDESSWPDVEPATWPKPYLLFCANFDGYLDDALFVIEAMSRLKNSNVDLLMVGKASAKTVSHIEDVIKAAGLGKRVFLKTEYVPTQRLYSLYVGAVALLAPLHDNVRSKARFPSKIADYLMSARPVVSCAVGEVARYLKDRETAFLSEPDNVQAFSDKIQEALTCTNREAIGQRGRHVAETQFDYRLHGQQLLDFLQTILDYKNQSPPRGGALVQ